MSTHPFPAALEQIPVSYAVPAEQQGQLQDLHYQTYESMTYAQKSQVLTKRAVIYVPYGYDPAQKYPVLFLQHGGWSNETTILGAPGAPGRMKHVLDHGIAEGKIEPMIVVCPTYNNLSEKDSGDFELAIKLTDNFRNEVRNDLIPAVEKTYSVYSDRDHRAFCGFSMGSMTTWRMFQYCLDQFRYFMPSSGGPALSAEEYGAIVAQSGYQWNDFFIFAASGTEDFAYNGFKRGIDALAAEGETFRVANNAAEGNLYYLEQEGGVHSAEYADLYSYNAMRWLWK